MAIAFTIVDDFSHENNERKPELFTRKGKKKLH